MEFTPEEEERINAIQRYLEGEKPVEIYRSTERSKRWFNKWLSRYKTGRDGWYKDLPQKGDLNHDGQVTAADAIIALQMAVSRGHSDDVDMNRDGSATSLDALMILQAACGKVDLS